jgi:hypothetical protein
MIYVLLHNYMQLYFIFFDNIKFYVSTVLNINFAFAYSKILKLTQYLISVHKCLRIALYKNKLTALFVTLFITGLMYFFKERC